MAVPYVHMRAVFKMRFELLPLIEYWAGSSQNISDTNVHKSHCPVKDWSTTTAIIVRICVRKHVRMRVLQARETCAHARKRRKTRTHLLTQLPFCRRLIKQARQTRGGHFWYAWSVLMHTVAASC